MVDEQYKSDGELVLRHWRGGWWVWTTTHWIEIEERLVRKALYVFTEHAVFIDEKTKKILQRSPFVDIAPEDLKPWAPNRHRMADLGDVLAAISYLATHMRTPSWLQPDDCAPNAELVSCKNGLLNIATRSLRPHTPTLFNTTSVPFDYEPGAPLPTRFLTFLNELWPDDQASKDALQEFFGYVISGRTDLHKILLMIGPTLPAREFSRSYLKDLVGDGNYCGPSLASLATQFGMWPLIGKPLAIVSDARLGGKNTHQVVERLLSISGEDMLTVDRKFLDPWTGTLPTRFLVISNELPTSVTRRARS